MASSAYADRSVVTDYSYGGAPSGYSWYVYRDDLHPYGDWEYIVGYGYVWRPHHVSVTWAPYYHGHWVFTSYGWTWVSTEPYGWITYHYGYWTYTHRWGWVWAPGYVWAPAHVVWYRSGRHVAWRPAAPPSDERRRLKDHIKDPPVTMVDRDHFTAEDIQKYAKVENIKGDGDALLTTDGGRFEMLSDPTPERQRLLAPGPVETLDVVPTAVDHAQGKTYGYYRVDKQRLYVPKPALTPAAENPARFTVPPDPDRYRRGIRVVPKPEEPKPTKPGPEPKKKPKKKVVPPKEEPKKTEPKKADKK